MSTGSSRVRRSVSLGIVVVMVALAGACAPSGHRLTSGASPADAAPLTPSTSATSVVPDPAPTPATSADQTAVLRSLVVRPADLGSSWTLLDAAPVANPHAGPCGSRLWDGEVAGFSAEYTFNLSPDGSEQGHLVSSAWLAPDPIVAERQRQLLDSADYRPCLEAEVQKDLGATFAKDAKATIVGSTTTRLADPPLPGSDFRVSTRFHDGGDGVSTAEVLHMYAGRLEVVLRVSSCSCAEFPTATVAKLIGALTQRAQAAKTA